MRHYLKLLALIIVSVLVFSLMTAGCSASPFSSARKDQLKVIASIYPMADFARKIGGDHVSVVQLIPAGFEPHAWEPSTTDMKTFEEADVFIMSGAGMEMWADKVLSSIRNPSLLTIDTSFDVPLILPGAYSLDGEEAEADHDEAEAEHEHDADEDHDPENETEEHDHDPENETEEHDHDHENETEEHDHDHGSFDPHVWLDPANAKIQMKSICEAFCRADPDHEKDYRANYEKYAADLDALDGEYRAALSSVENPYIVVSHEAFGYLCKAYGLRQIPIRGISADAEPDAARMREIIEMTGRYHVRVIFFEALGSPKVAEAIARETGCETKALHPIGGLTQEQIDAGEDYFSIMRSNLEALNYALTLE